MKRWIRLIVLASSGASLLAACKYEGTSLIAYSQALTTQEEVPVSGQLQATNHDLLPFRFALGAAQHGKVTSFSPDGHFVFEPDPDFFGTAGFTYHVANERSRSSSAHVTIFVDNVNDPPVIATIPSLHNSPETESVVYQVVVLDPDPDQHQLLVSATDAAVVDATIDEHGLLSLRALAPGTATVEIIAADSQYSHVTSFEFSATEVTKERAVSTATHSGAITIANQSTEQIDFVLEHNAFPVFENLDDVVAHVEALAAEFPGELFEHKLWRFLRDNTRHYYPPMPLQFAHAPWATLSSLGFGFCADVATSYVAIARTAGYEARVWSIGGHVVPEIYAGGRWQMYDPDLGVYYLDRDGQAAGVEQLSADPSLVTNPTAPILGPDAWDFPYSPIIAGYFSTASDNRLADSVLLPEITDMQGRFFLPAGSTMTYPGRWTEPLIAYDVFATEILRESMLPDWRELAQQHDGAVPRVIPFHKQAKLDLPDGWTGELPLPLWLWDVQGSGTVAIGEISYAIGSDALRERLRYQQPPRSIRILSGHSIALIMQINFVKFDLRETNSVRVRGFDVWGLTIDASDIGAHYGGESWEYARGEP